MSQGDQRDSAQDGQFEATGGLLDTESDGDAADGDVTTTVDWPALWDEFGFDSPDVVGNEFASGTQLVAAIESSEQDIAGDPSGHIASAVDDGVLHKLTTAGGVTRGYVLEVCYDE